MISMIVTFAAIDHQAVALELNRPKAVKRRWQNSWWVSPFCESVSRNS